MGAGMLTMSKPPPLAAVDPDATPPNLAQRPGAVPIALRGVSKQFGTGVQALDTIDFDIAGGEFISIVGPSGCGKSTLLRIVASLVEPTTGACERARPRPSCFRMRRSCPGAP